MDSRQAAAHLPRSFWTLAALTVTWWSLAPGLYFLFSGVVAWGTLLSAVGVVSLLITLSRPILHKLEARTVYRPLALLFVAVVLVMALAEVWTAISFAPGTAYPPGVVGFHAALLLVSGAATAMQLRQARGRA
ncbi:MAG TPA: hypothetical protein VJJ46_05370 [Anaerolineales bacterium]|nr:hypothetical protein [Anaerolineales bacterium]